MKGFSVKTFLIIILIVSCVVFGINICYSDTYSFQSIIETLIWIVIYTAVMYALHFGLHHIIDLIFPENRNLLYRLITQIIGSFFTSILGALICAFFTNLWFDQIPFERTFESQNIFKFYFFPASISFIISLLIHIKEFYKKYYALQNLHQQMQTEKISRQYDSLQQQLSPHFLFNSLNVLESLIEENQNQAQVFTQDLATIYRYVLQQENQLMISVSEELQFAKTYIHLMNQRFENAIQLSIDENITKDLMILPLSIQLALENAIKHNTFSEEKPLKITINQVDENLVVRNNLSPKTLKDTTQKGLANIQNRLATFGKNASIEKTENEFILTIPLLTQNQIIMENNYQSDKAQQVEKRIKELKGFYNHLFSFIFINAGLIALNVFQNYYYEHSIWWVQWSLMGWGIGLASHALRTFRIINPVLGKNWEERKRKELMNQ